jgi:MFS family permease
LQTSNNEVPTPAEVRMPEPSRRRRYLILAICCMSLLIVGLDNTIVNVALPSIRRELNASLSGLQWTVAAYTLVLASLLMLSGSTAARTAARLQPGEAPAQPVGTP